MGAGGVVKDSWLRVAGGDTGVAIKGEGGEAVTPVTAGDGGVADTVAVETASPVLAPPAGERVAGDLSGRGGDREVVVAAGGEMGGEVAGEAEITRRAGLGLVAVGTTLGGGSGESEAPTGVIFAGIGC